MKGFRDLSIQRKLMLVLMLTSGVVLLLATAGFLVYDYVTFREKMVSDLVGLAEMIQVNASTALVFNDRDTGEKLVQALKARPRIVRAYLLNPESQVFAQYSRDGESAAPPPSVVGRGQRFEGDRLLVFEPVDFNGNVVGTIYLESDTEEIRARVRDYATILAVLLPSLFIVAFILSSLAQRVVSRPILDLDRVARTVSGRRDFSVRAKKYAHDEIGVLAPIHERLYLANVNVYAASGVSDGRGGFGYVIYVRPEQFEQAAKALNV